jgi:hypothetical protein
MAVMTFEIGLNDSEVAVRNFRKNTAHCEGYKAE